MNKKDWFYVVAIFVVIITLIIMMDYVRENSTIQLENKYQLTNCTKGRGDNTVYCDEGKLSKFDYDRALNTIQGEQVDMAIEEALVDYYTREEVGAMLLERDNQIGELQEYKEIIADLDYDDFYEEFDKRYAQNDWTREELYLIITAFEIEKSIYVIEQEMESGNYTEEEMYELELRLAIIQWQLDIVNEKLEEEVK